MLIPSLLSIDLEFVGVLESAVDGERPLADVYALAHVVVAGCFDVCFLITSNAIIEAKITVGVEEDEVAFWEILSRVSGTPRFALKRLLVGITCGMIRVHTMNWM